MGCIFLTNEHTSAADLPAVIAHLNVDVDLSTIHLSLRPQFSNQI